MNNNTMNFIAEKMQENRMMASVQLTADDMTKVDWENYRALCDTIAIEAYKSICKSDKGDLAGAIKVLFDALGIDAKATAPMVKRYVLGCVAISKNYSVKYKNTMKALRAQKTVCENLEEKIRNNNATITEEELMVHPEYAPSYKALQDYENLINELKTTPGNIWNNFKPMLDASKKHASAKCRKYIEDITADIITERELMSYKDLLLEAETLKVQRKASKKLKDVSEEEAKAIIEGKTEIAEAQA